jgi:hypothetical protein
MAGLGTITPEVFSQGHITKLAGFDERHPAIAGTEDEMRLVEPRNGGTVEPHMRATTRIVAPQA